MLVKQPSVHGCLTPRRNVSQYKRKKVNMKKFLLIALLSSTVLGCGSGETILPTDKLTPEQIEKIKAEDKAVAEEEGGRK